MPSLKSSIMEALKAAMKAREQTTIDTLRLLNAAFKQIEVDERIELDDARCLVVIEKQVKQRRESISAFDQAGREDLSGKEKAELEILLRFLPEPASDAELDHLISTAIAETGATSARDMGRVMNIIRPLLAGRADMTAVSLRVKERLTR